MSQQRLESRLADLQDETLPELPELVHLRMEETYRIISEKDDVGLEAASEHQGTLRRKRMPRWLSRVMISAASVAGGLVLLISLGFISPAMAETLKQLPFMSSVFQLAGDSGLRKANEAGLTTNVEQTVTLDGMTLKVSEQMYDGSRFSVVLTRVQAKEEQKKEEWWDLLTQGGQPAGGINNIEFLVNGEKVNTGYGFKQGGAGAPDSIIVSALDGPNLQIPDQFDLTMLVLIDGMDQKFRFEFPVSKKTVGDLVLGPGETKVHDHIHLRYTRLELSQTSTRLLTEIKGDPGADLKAIEEAIPDKYKDAGTFMIWFELWDDHGQKAVVISGSGSGKGDTFSYSMVFEPFENRPESVIIKSFVISKDGGKQYIPELEMSVPIQ
ncbi:MULTISPECIES: DUF4179 domain-containing protein [unclassified Paenibacillus]|uniref:DUF4179 domain-containing protein n=1 Tax=unclassified Paenibacillus TaxID=185978 RepID=UPI00096D4183|nr:hypothetical protein BK146_02340 [Paenibacillus sp. FSL R7-0333]